MRRGLITAIVALAAALFLALAAPMAAADVPIFEHGAWVLPVNSHNTATASSGRYEDMIAEACAYYGCNPAYLETVMQCESNGDPYATAYNPVSGNLTVGLFQIDEMWGVGYDPATQIWWAAEHLTKGDVYWVCA